MENLTENTSNFLRYYGGTSSPASETVGKFRSLEWTPVSWNDFVLYDSIQTSNDYKSVEQLTEEITVLQEKLEVLRTLQKENLSHILLGKYSFSFLVFFLVSLSSKLFLDVTIVQPLWNYIGLFFSFGFLIMSWGMRNDWDKKLED